MTQAGFAGNLRYVALPAAFVCVLAGAGWVVARARRARPRGPLAAALALVLALAVAAVPFRADVDDAARAIDRVHEEAVLYGATRRALIAKAGGEARVRRCGRVFTGRFQVQAVAWRLHLHGGDVGIFPYAARHGARAEAFSRHGARPALPARHGDGGMDGGPRLRPLRRRYPQSMATVAPRPALAAARAGGRPAPVLAPLALGALVVVSLLLRTRELDVGFWIDEGISVGIADRPLIDIPGTLRLDGSPPLYYMLLHVWMQVAGTSRGGHARAVARVRAARGPGRLVGARAPCSAPAPAGSRRCSPR